MTKNKGIRSKCQGKPGKYDTEAASVCIQRVVGASGGITYGRVARETEIQLVGVLDRPG